MNTTTQASAALIDGKACAEQVLAEVAVSVKQLIAEGTTPGLAVVLIGEDPASQVYVKNTNAQTTKRWAFAHSSTASTPP